MEVGINFFPDVRPEEKPADIYFDECLRLLSQADELGFESVWLAESYYARSAMPLAALMGAATRRIKIALGIVPTHTRHPTLNAMEAATHSESVYSFDSASEFLQISARNATSPAELADLLVMPLERLSPSA